MVWVYKLWNNPEEDQADDVIVTNVFEARVIFVEPWSRGQYKKNRRLQSRIQRLEQGA